MRRQERRAGIASMALLVRRFALRQMVTIRHLFAFRPNTPTQSLISSTTDTDITTQARVDGLAGTLQKNKEERISSDLWIMFQSSRSIYWAFVRNNAASRAWCSNRTALLCHPVAEGGH